MSELQENLRELIKESELTIYALATKSGIERSYLSKILSGKRKMSFDNFISIVDAVCENEESRAKLIDSYISEMFSRERFETYFNHLTNDITKQAPKVRTTVTEIPDGLTCINSQLEILSFANYLLSDKNETTRIYTNFPVTSLLSVACERENCDYRCIVNPALNEKTVSIFDLIRLNLICCTSYIDDGSSARSKNTLFPYVIITDNYVLFSAKDLKSGYCVKNSELADLYAKEFSGLCKRMKVNSQIHDDILNVKEPISKYLFKRQTHRIVNNSLSVVPFMTRNDWEELARPDLPDRGYLINTTYEYYHEFFDSIETHIFLAPLSGLINFCETGIVSEMPPEYSTPLSVKTRIALLERIIEYIKYHPEKYKLNFFKTTTIDASEPVFSIESAFDPKADCKTTLITMSADKTKKTYFMGNYIFLSTDKDAVTEYNTFFDLLRVSDKVMTRDETLAAIEDRLLRLKYNDKNINTAIGN